ncbi:hypothetical protein OESDEN_06528 [Oesophagostomum dentatum]|uniref:Complex I assembly factor TIMMDC1, mitochondrial n=1 Tax=Oesophagostomum dentatum TaxID=61180 RepID=A0A0B1T7M5_OESDE|nr:hypothetical protein OESDEN_06528 [Oesophagostomum dentatum]
MAAGVREMVRPPRLAYLQRIVRNLSTFQEMRDLRFQLASAPLSTAESKTSFFKNAFDVANRLLFNEHQTLPVTATSNKQFEAFLKASQMVVSAEHPATGPVPLRSQCPTTLPHIHHCVAVNILLPPNCYEQLSHRFIALSSLFLSMRQMVLSPNQYWTKYQHLLSLMHCRYASVPSFFSVSSSLNLIILSDFAIGWARFKIARIRSTADGDYEESGGAIILEMRDLRFQLASAPLSTAESKTSFFKNAFDVANRLLFNFRHFFTHRLHPDIVEQTLSVFTSLDEGIENNEELQGDLAGALVAAASLLCNNGYLDVSVDDEVFSMFEQAVFDQSAPSIKQIRYLENADLHLEQIHVNGESSSELPILPTWQSLLASIDWYVHKILCHVIPKTVVWALLCLTAYEMFRSQPADKHPPLPFEEYLLDIPVSERKDLRAVYKPISSAGAFGAPVSDIKIFTGLPPDTVENILKELARACQIICVGVDVHRWVAAEYASAWCVKVAGNLVCPRPWTMPTGEICPSTVRWMAESVLMTIVSSPGITIKEISFRLEFALQAAAVHDLVSVLVRAGCVQEIEELFEDMTLQSPFQKECMEIGVTYLLPVVGCIETFARIFGGIALLPAMTGRTDGEKDEEVTEDKSKRIASKIKGTEEMKRARSMSSGQTAQSPTLSWWNWSYWTSKSNPLTQSPSKPAHTEVAIHESTAAASESPATSSTPAASSVSLEEDVEPKLSGWERIRALYEKPSMEHDCSKRVTRMVFLTGFFVGGAATYAQAHETYERSNVGRKYLSPSDAFKRRMDYAIVRFAKSGFLMGAKAAFISGSIVILSTHLAAYRQRFSSWYLPAFSALVGGVFTFPLGLVGSMKAVGLGVTSGLTLAAVVHLYALSMDKTVDQAYWTFKREYEDEMRMAREWDERVTAFMKAEGYKWRGSAAQRLKKLDEEKLAAQDT